MDGVEAAFWPVPPVPAPRGCLCWESDRGRFGGGRRVFPRARAKFQAVPTTIPLQSTSINRAWQKSWEIFPQSTVPGTLGLLPNNPKAPNLWGAFYDFL